MKFGIVLFDEVEVLDAFGPFEVFSVAARLHSAEEVDVTLISAYADRMHILARGGLKVTADLSIAQAPEFDVLLIPGGVTTELEKDQHFIKWLAGRKSTPTIASVCTGAFLLATAGILADETVTTHWEDQAELARRFPSLTVIDGPRWVQQQNLYTSAGISAGLDLALHLLKPLDPTLSTRVARQMDYAWNESTDR